VAGIAEGSVLAPDELAAERVERGIKLLLAFFILASRSATRITLRDPCSSSGERAGIRLMQSFGSDGVVPTGRQGSRGGLLACRITPERT
jgi:hypothetical protein